MSSDWKTFKLRELGRIVTGKTPKTADANNFGGRIPFITPSDMDGRKTIKSTARYLTITGASSVKGSVIPSGSIMVSCIGSDMGKTVVSGYDCVTNQQINSIIVDKRFNSDFVYYNLSMRKSELQLLASSGSTMPILNKSLFSGIDILIPPLSTQTQIAAILSTLDDRIALLRETNTTLEAIAQALFKSWFVDFDPVRAKQEGREPEGMDADTAALFPDSFEESELGLIPEGWIQVPFTDTVNVIGGGTPKTSMPEYWNGKIPWFSVVDAPQISDVFVIDTQKHISEQGLNNSSTKLLATGTTIISARGTVGRLALVGRQMAMNQSCYGLRGKAGDSFFTYFSTYRLIASLKQRSHGSVFDTITTNTMSGVYIIYPDKSVIHAFETLLKPVMDRLLNNLEHIKTLTSLRDTLLPRLISGQLRIPEAETLIEEVGV